MKNQMKSTLLNIIDKKLTLVDDSDLPQASNTGPAATAGHEYGLDNYDRIVEDYLSSQSGQYLFRLRNRLALSILMEINAELELTNMGASSNTPFN